MKVNKKDIIYLIFAFIISITFITWGFSQIIFKDDPQFKVALLKSNISQVEYVLAVCGKQLPEKKVKVFNNLVKKDDQFDYSKDNVKSYSGNRLLFLIPSLILTLILYTQYSKIKDGIKKKKRAKQKLFLKKNYIIKYSLDGKEFKVKCSDGTISNKQILNKLLIYWIRDNAIYFVNNDYENDLGLFDVKFNNISCFSRYGDFYTSMNVTGGDSSYGMAALGYLIAGPAGAVIASRNSLSSNTIVHDKRETLLFVQENNKEKYIFFDPDFYDIMMHILPSKEINIMAKKGCKYEENNDKFEKIKKLGELREKGYIDEVEFTKLKSELI